MTSWFPIMLSTLALMVSASVGYFAARDRKTSILLGREGDLRDWLDQIKQAYVVIMTGATDERRVALKHLSALIDIGRIYFPGDGSGLRSSVLDPLVELHKRVSTNDMEDRKASADWRKFTDELRQRTTAFQINTSPEMSGKTQYKNP